MLRESLGNGSYFACFTLDHICIFHTFSESLKKALFVLVIQSEIVLQKICCLGLPGGPCHRFFEERFSPKSDVGFGKWLSLFSCVHISFDKKL